MVFIQWTRMVSVYCTLMDFCPMHTDGFLFTGYIGFLADRTQLV